jgi:hypothetical protein
MVTSNVSTAIEDHRDPIEPKSFVVKFRSGVNGSELSSPWEDVSAARLQDAAPWRAFRWHRGQKHYSGIVLVSDTTRPCDLRVTTRVGGLAVRTTTGLYAASLLSRSN